MLDFLILVPLMMAGSLFWGGETRDVDSLAFNTSAAEIVTEILSSNMNSVAEDAYGKIVGKKFFWFHLQQILDKYALSQHDIEDDI